MSLNNRPAIAGLILAGGEGSRLGGVFKPGLRLNNRTLLSHCLESLVPQIDELLISSGPHAAKRFAAVPNCTLIPDPPGAFGGPAVAISMALEALLKRQERPEYLVTVPGDTPGLPADFVAQLLARQKQTRADVVMASYKGQIHPIHALWRVPALARRADKVPLPWRNERVRYLLDNRVECDFEATHEHDPFLGVNRVVDLLALGAGKSPPATPGRKPEQLRV